MIRNNWLTLHLIAAFLMASPSALYAQGSDGKEKEPEPEAKAVLKELRDVARLIAKDISSLSLRIDKLADQVSTLKADVENLKKAAPDANAIPLPDRLDDVIRRLAAIEQAMKTTREAKSSPIATSRLEIVNNFNEGVTFFVNKVRYDIPPQEARFLNVPAGPLVYKVGWRDEIVQPEKTLSLVPGQILKLSASPPPN